MEMCIPMECVYLWHYLRTEKEDILVNSQNIKQAIGMQTIFIFKMKLQKEQLLAKYDFFSASDASISNTYCNWNVHAMP